MDRETSKFVKETYLQDIFLSLQCLIILLQWNGGLCYSQMIISVLLYSMGCQILKSLGQK